MFNTLNPVSENWGSVETCYGTWGRSPPLSGPYLSHSLNESLDALVLVLRITGLPGGKRSHTVSKCPWHGLCPACPLMTLLLLSLSKHFPIHYLPAALGWRWGGRLLLSSQFGREERRGKALPSCPNLFPTILSPGSASGPLHMPLIPLTWNTLSSTALSLSSLCSNVSMFKCHPVQNNSPRLPSLSMPLLCSIFLHGISQHLTFNDLFTCLLSVSSPRMSAP